MRKSILLGNTRSLRNDNKISRHSNLHFQNCTVMTPSKKNRLFARSSSVPPMPPLRKRKQCCYCHLAVYLETRWTSQDFAHVPGLPRIPPEALPRSSLATSQDLPLDLDFKSKPEVPQKSPKLFQMLARSHRASPTAASVWRTSPRLTEPLFRGHFLDIV